MRYLVNRRRPNGQKVLLTMLDVLSYSNGTLMLQSLLFDFEIFTALHVHICCIDSVMIAKCRKHKHIHVYLNTCTFNFSYLDGNELTEIHYEVFSSLKSLHRL